MIVKINGVAIQGGAPVQIVEKPVDKSPKSKAGEILYSSGASLWGLIVAYMDLSDYLAVGVFMFAGTAWMFGHRSRAIELLIGGALGYLIILHAPELKDFLKGISKH